MTTQIAVFGLGTMGEAIIKALLKSGTKKKHITGIEIKRDRADSVADTHGIEATHTPSDIVKVIDKARYIIFAVKPQDARDLIHEIAPFLRDDQVIISIMAGITTSNLHTLIGRPTKIIRIMPNIAVKVGEGAMGITAAGTAGREDLDEVIRILAPLGKIIEISEDLMDAVTALGGSGPAFFLLFLEAMIDGGVRVGIPRDKSRAFALQVAQGTLKMIEEDNLHPTVLKEMVTSPGGTTIAGLSVLEERGFKGSIMKAIEEARNRAKELSL